MQLCICWLDVKVSDIQLMYNLEILSQINSAVNSELAVLVLFFFETHINVD